MGNLNEKGKKNPLFFPHGTELSARTARRIGGTEKIPLGQPDVREKPPARARWKKNHEKSPIKRKVGKRQSCLRPSLKGLPGELGVDAWEAQRRRPGEGVVHQDDANKEVV